MGIFTARVKYVDDSSELFVGVTDLIELMDNINSTEVLSIEIERV